MNKKTQQTMFSSKTEMWETPQDLFNKLNDKYVIRVNVQIIILRKLTVFLKNGGGYNCWCNPPYGREIGKWVEKAATSNTKVVMLLPARTDTKWFHEYILHKADIYFIKGRLKFGNSKNSAPFPSLIAVYDPGKKDKEITYLQ